MDKDGNIKLFFMISIHPIQNKHTNMETSSYTYTPIDWSTKWLNICDQFSATLDDFKDRYARASDTSNDDEARTFLDESAQQLQAQSREMKQLTQTIFQAIHDLRDHTQQTMDRIDRKATQIAKLKRGKTQLDAKEQSTTIQLDEYTQIYNTYYWACWRMVALIVSVGVVAKSRL